LKSRLSSFVSIAAVAICCLFPDISAASSCVWKVIGPSGGIMYLGGSVHALRSSNYPLPTAYNRALDGSSRVVFEDDPKTGANEAKELLRAGTYPKGDTLKNHVDPRTYAYIRRFFALVNVPENEFAKYRPWLINMLLSSPSIEHWELGVEQYVQRHAAAKSKPVSGLESPKEHNAFFVNLTDRESEALLLILFIDAAHDGPTGVSLIKAWRRGDAETLNRIVRESFQDFPSLARGLLDARNRNWLLKIDGYLRSGKTYFVVVGAGHMGGPNGLLALLKSRGCKIEQL
jgi:uncharacterized protein YbaP (TraB family)